MEDITNEITKILTSIDNKLDTIIKQMEKVTKDTNVRNVINTLSYSELLAALSVFEELDGKEGLLVAGKIAEKIGITRSVIVNSLRKLESAALIESRSLGMKGTFIKVLNEDLLTEFAKLRN